MLANTWKLRVIIITRFYLLYTKYNTFFELIYLLTLKLDLKILLDISIITHWKTKSVEKNLDCKNCFEKVLY